MTSKLAERRTSIFERISGLAREHGAVNLGQGFPDFGWPEDVVEKAAEALRTGSNQYPPMRGLPVLREAVAEHYGRHQDRKSVVWGRSVSVRVDLGGRRIIKKKNQITTSSQHP